MPGSQAAAEKKLHEIGIGSAEGSGPAGAATLTLRGQKVDTPWARLHGLWVTYIDGSGRCLSVPSAHVDNVEWT